VRRALAAAVLAGLVAVAAAPARAASSGTIRVAIVEGARVVEVRGDLEVTPLAVGGAPVALAGCAGCPGGGWHAAVVHAVESGAAVEIGDRRAPGFRLASEAPIRVNGRDYGGRLDVLRLGAGLTIVNELPLEEYLGGVLRAEANERWPLEALRAQAIVARTYAAYHREIGAGKAYHLVASTANQGYLGRVPATSPVWRAVHDTAGQVLRWEGELFPAFYHTESGGYTEDPRMVFAAKNMPALKPVTCPFSAGSPHFFWNLDLRLADLAAALRRHDVDVGVVTAVEVSQRTPSLRAAFVTVRGTRGSQRLRGNDFRRMVGYDTLKSTLFAVAVTDGTAHFAGRGYGHGVGMCQWGAKGMAEQGYRAPDILRFYYPGTVLGTLGDPS
jgi:stage II sporulation protein D